MRIKIFLVALIIGSSVFLSAQSSNESIIRKVNKIRSESHYCGRKYMPATDPVHWNSKLFNSAMSHAKEMKRYNFFTHYSRKGEGIGKRIEKFDYDWLIAGENIAKGQKTVDETLEDWLESKSHCKMLLNPKVTEIAMAKSGKYRVMHFGHRGS